ncbi:hypothetical protein VTN77DRAFT_5592 [Rasamsonia byssochlamydoides]|uniref:uncharacterized protein n=1 Tax=Rasamsonia byssochlamydoides TaxID=89139 RepID=UPI003743AC57
MSTEVMAANETPVPVTGAPGALPPVDEVKEYEKILRISDEIFAGTHPRLKVPPQFVRKVPSRTLQTPTTTTASAEPSGTPQSKSGPATSQAASTATSASTAPSVSTRVAPKPTSEIDPIFLTKSDDLVRAEIQLQRQRVERMLREQLEQRRLEARQKASAQEARPDFDVTDVLNKALEIVKPLPPPSDVHGANGTTVPSDSFDENSFYSSRAPDSPQHEPASSESERLVRPQDTEGALPADVTVGRRSDGLPRPEAAEPGVTDTDTQGSLYNATDKPILPQSQKQSLSAAVPAAHADKYAVPREPEEPLDEPEYSPPEPVIPPVDNRDHHEYHRREALNPRKRSYERPAERTRMGQRSYSPASDVRIVRNHITSPAAPQPSRVSPLAMAKVPSVHQLRSAQQDYRPERVSTDPYSGRTSPEQLIPRKRRRLQESRERRHAAESPEPYIKQEPVSPPPFADVPPASQGRSRQPQERPVYIDIASPRYTPSIDRREAISREPVYELDRYGNNARDYDAPVEANIARTVSRMSSRRPARDTQDLRRVASLHHARHPEVLSREYAEPAGGVHPRSMRASSYAVVERPTYYERPRYYDETIPSYPRRYAPVDELPPSPGFRETYVDEEPPPPRQRRIVVDEHGNQYYETVPAPKVCTMPPPPSRVAKVEDYNERAHIRNGSVRATSIVDDPYGDRRYVHDMPPPPQTTYRRVVDYPRGVVEERRPYRPVAEREPAYRSSSVVVDYAPRHSTYVEDHEIPRERLVRMSSVRPPATRYEEPREVHRVQSVRPGGREVSYVDEEPRPQREYMDRPVYTSMRPVRDERYYDDEDAGRIVLDGTGEVVHRVPQRY